MAAKKESTPGFDFDMSKYVAEMNKLMGDMKTPGMDVQALMAAQRKNIEAVAAANRLAFEGLQAVMMRQGEIVRQTMEEVGEIGKSMAEPGSPQDKAAKQAEITKDVFERTLSNLREMSEMVAKSNNEAFDLLNKRFAQSLDELRGMIKESGKK